MLFLSRYRLRSDTLSPVETTNSFSSFACCTYRTWVSCPRNDALNTVCVHFIYVNSDVHWLTVTLRVFPALGETTVQLQRREKQFSCPIVEFCERGGIPLIYAFAVVTFSRLWLFVHPTGAWWWASRCPRPFA